MNEEKLKCTEELYVSHDTEKLLKERGFNYWIESTFYENKGTRRTITLKRPSLSVAMTWLREVHNLSVEVYRTACGYIGCVVAIPSGTDIHFLETDGDDLPSGQYTKWEYACDATIKYCLKNLVK